MKICYFDAGTRSIIDLTPTGSAYMINRISVLPPHRGRGHASLLMRQVVDDADEEGAILQLSIEPGINSSMGFHALFRWYTRWGFRTINPMPMMRRLPNHSTPWTIEQYNEMVRDHAEQM